MNIKKIFIICMLLLFAVTLGGCGEFKEKIDMVKDLIPKYEQAMKEIGKYKDLLATAKAEVKNLKKIVGEVQAEADKYKSMYEEVKKENDELKRSLNRMYK
jgi:peptidoglycan hydrolase CwlO-like protein